jgi:hypothetical protein
MSFTRLGQFGPTQKVAVTNSAPAALSRFTPGLSDITIRRYVLTADANVFIERNADATTSSAILVANQPYQIEMIGTGRRSICAGQTQRTLFATAAA